MLIAATTAPAAAVKFPGCTNDAKDINGDKLCEDINGNGILDFDDVVKFNSSLKNSRFWWTNFNNTRFFNFDGKWNGFNSFFFCHIIKFILLFL
jgi:PKD repeat protein